MPICTHKSIYIYLSITSIIIRIKCYKMLKKCYNRYKKKDGVEEHRGGRGLNGEKGLKRRLHCILRQFLVIHEHEPKELCLLETNKILVESGSLQLLEKKLEHSLGAAVADGSVHC